MKQIIAFIIAVGMLACTFSMTSFAVDIKYPVDDISDNFYVLDDDNDLYLDNAASKVSYGKTAYFPLLSAASSAVSDKQAAYDKALAEYNTAQKLYDDNYKPELDAYNQKKTEADQAITTWENFDYDTEKQKIEQEITTAQGALTEAEGNRDQAWRTFKASSDVYDAKNKVWVDSGSPPNGPLKEEREQALTQMETDRGLYTNLRDNVVPQKEQALSVARGKLGTLDDKKDELEQTKNRATSALTTAETALKNATGKGTVDLAIKAVGDAQTDMGKKKTAKDNAEQALKEAQESNKYKYVYEQAAIKSMRVTSDWEEGRNYVSDVDVVKMRVHSTINGATTSSMKYIYCLAIKIKQGSSTQNRDVFGTVKLRKSGSDGFEFSTDINLEVGYTSASNSDAGEGTITSTPTTFKEGDGFDAEEDFTFYFEDDSNSYFMVDTNSQGSIVLSFDTEPDDDLFNDYPDANLWFYNGNYASFNRVGDLFLSFPEDNGYVYEVSKSGRLTRINPEYDEYEEAYQIRTRTLGRYVISETRLKTTGGSSGGSSGTGTGTGTGSGSGGTGGTGGGTSIVVPSIPSVPSYPYTPPTSSSSIAPPVASSSSSEESQEEESSSEPEELEDEDAIIDVVIDDQDPEGPEEKSGIPRWVWALIIVGLAAIPVAIGIIYYLNNRPLRRDFFDEETEEYDDDDLD
ncbi:MAG: coiled-coil domain-containing protein [Candidatus Fimivivens sp.]